MTWCVVNNSSSLTDGIFYTHMTVICSFHDKCLCHEIMAILSNDMRVWHLAMRIACWSKSFTYGVEVRDV